MKTITITGRDIIEYNGNDNTGALAELGVTFTPRNDGCFDTDIANLTFQVDLDFVLRHGLLDNRISESHYKGSSEYLRYYNEGRDAYLAGKEEDPPYDTGTVVDPDYWRNSIHHKRYPWYDGYRETRAAVMETKYRIKDMQAKIARIIKKHELVLDHEDEYGYPYAKTSEGYTVKLS